MTEVSFQCVDCQVDTYEIREYYMVHDHVWAQSGLGPCDGMLCVGCLEKRLGYRLHKPDFTDAPINKNWGHQSKRLQTRMGVDF